MHLGARRNEPLGFPFFPPLWAWGAVPGCRSSDGEEQAMETWRVRSWPSSGGTWKSLSRFLKGYTETWVRVDPTTRKKKPTLIKGKRELKGPDRCITGTDWNTEWLEHWGCVSQPSATMTKCLRKQLEGGNFILAHGFRVSAMICWLLHFESEVRRAFVAGGHNGANCSFHTGQQAAEWDSQKAHAGSSFSASVPSGSLPYWTVPPHSGWICPFNMLSYVSLVPYITQTFPAVGFTNLSIPQSNWVGN